MDEKPTSWKNDEQRAIEGAFLAIAKDLESHNAAIARLAENQTAEHAKLIEMADIVNKHTDILESLRRAVEAKMGKPPDEQPGPVN